jgi:hypothetical protein
MSMSKWEHRREDLKDLSLTTIFFGGGTAIAGFLVDTVVYPYETAPGLIRAAEAGGIATFILGAIGYVALTANSHRSRDD